MLQLVMTDLIHLAKLEREGVALRQRFLREGLAAPLGDQPAATCCKCNQLHHGRQHRVVRTPTAKYTLAASKQRWSKPLPADVIELNFSNGWFYVSLQSPLTAIFKVLQDGELPWLCPNCAGYASRSNLFAPMATILTDTAELRHVPHFMAYAQA